MNQINYTNLGGLPLTQNQLDFLQSSYANPLTALGNFIGDKSIISGVDIVAGNASNGYVVINGELLPFIGGPVGAEVVIVENITQELFDDGITKDVYKDRYATFGSPGIAFNIFSKLDTLKNMFYSLCPIDSVVNYEGLVADLPPNWVVHVLSKGRVIVGQDITDADFAAIGQTGGEKKHTQTVPEMPAHTHNVSEIGDSHPDSVATYRAIASNTDGPGGLNIDIKMKPTGGGNPFNVLNPYYIMARIKRIS
jgi:hypothetical protein